MDSPRGGLPESLDHPITPYPSPYMKVNVLMLSWKDISDPTERGEFQTQLCRLSEEFKAYRFAVEEYEIESDMPYRKLSQRLHEFLHHDEKGTLLILYYGGHGLNNRDSHCIWLRDNPEDSDESTNPGVNWSTLQGLFLDDCLSHALFLLDCCYAGSSAKITNSTSTVEAIAAAGFEQVTPLRGRDSFTTFLTKVLREVRSKETTIVASVLARQISALLNSTEVTNKDTRVTPRHFPLHNGKGFIEIGSLPEQQSGPVSTSPAEGSSKAPSRRVDASSSRDAQETPVWRLALADAHGSPRRRVLSALRTPRPRDVAATALFNRHPIENRQIRVLKIKPFPLKETDEAIVCTVETIHLPEKCTDASNPNLGYKALSWYCAPQAPWTHWKASSCIIILPDYQRVPVPDELVAAFQDIRDPDDEISVWVYQICIDQSDPDEVESQALLVPDIFRCASEVIIWPGMEDDSSATALAFVPEVIDLRNIDDLVIGSPSPAPTPSSVLTMRFSTPPAYRPKQDGSTPPENSRRAASDRPYNIALPRTPTRLRYTDSDVPEKWKSLVDFMTRPYFERRWTFLEVALARSANIYCGDQRLSWSDFCDAVTLLGSRFEEVRLLLERAEMFGSIQNQYGQLADLRALGAYSFAEASRGLFPRQSDGSILGLCRLEKIVSALPVLRSWHPNAVIYALLPLANDADEWDNTEPTPTKAYQYFVRHCARISGSIDIICRPWAPTQKEIDKHAPSGGFEEDETSKPTTHTGTQRSPSWVHPPVPVQALRRQRHGLVENTARRFCPQLPSWVCQIDKHPFGDSGKDSEAPGRRNGEVFVGAPDKPIYNASKSSRASPVFGYFDDSGSLRYDGTMKTAGFQIGPIAQLHSRAADGIILTDWISALGGDDVAGIVPDHLWRTLVADRGPGGTPAPAWYHRACRYWLEYCGDDDISYQKLKGGKHSSMVVQYLVRVRSVIWNRRLFAIPGWEGRVLYGLAPKETKEKDMVCVLDGCSVPVVMRDEGRHWTLVGECFVYGIMDGEAVDDIIVRKRGKVQEFLIR